MNYDDLHKESLLDYCYIHSYFDHILKLDIHLTSSYRRNYIILFYQSSCVRFFLLYRKIRKLVITDVFILDRVISHKQQQIFFSLFFKELFWLKIEKVELKEEVYPMIINLLYTHVDSLNKLDLDSV